MPNNSAINAIPRLPRRPLLDVGKLSRQEVSDLVERARSLHAGHPDGPASPLRGRNIGLVCTAGWDTDASLLRAAGMASGAHVAMISPRSWNTSAAVSIELTARVLGRLYDIVVCQGVNPCLVQEIEAAAGIPVFDAIACWDDATLDLRLLPVRGVPALNQRLLLQAALQDAVLSPLNL
jgi:ornithine carbamoyltransferase